LAVKSPAETAAALMLVHYEAQLNDKRAVSFSVNVDRNCEQVELDSAMDKMRLAVDRQNKFRQLHDAEIDISKLEAEIAKTQFEIESTNKRYQKKRVKYQESGGRGDYEGMTEAESNQMADQTRAIDRMLGEIKKLQHRADELRLELKIESPMQQAAE
jgi:hypothetical protein